MKRIKEFLKAHVRQHKGFLGKYFALTRKEARQMTRNRQLLSLLIVMPIIQICLYGIALNPEVDNLSLGIIDYSRTNESRELISAIVENKVFKAKYYTESQKQLANLVEHGKINVGIMIPSDFKRKLHQSRGADVQVIIDGVDAYSSGLAYAYISQIISVYGYKDFSLQIRAPIRPRIIFAYNPGLINSWFFVLGVIGSLLTMVSVLSSAIQSIQEKDTGTLEQLLMTPATSLEILLSKILPLLIVQTGVAVFSLTLAHVLFGIPIRGSLLLFTVFSAIFVLIGIGFGVLLSTITQNRMQVILTSVFIALPMINTSGAITPLESMPKFFQIMSYLNPLRYYVMALRGLVLKGAGLGILWPEILALIVFAVIILWFSSRKYRSQLS